MLDMGAKVDQSKPSLPPKISIFGAKPGFLIPKNKLPGSLVARSNAKNDFQSPSSSSSSSVQDNNTNTKATLVQRNTRWGPDLTLDPAVRKSTASAYQTRLEQINKELKSGSMEISENEGSVSGSNSDGANKQKENVQGKAELLELERREIIGEILHLNPGYKVPEDYKPLLKETKIHLPTKAHSGHNIIGVLMRPESNAQKRLQEETGAKIRVYGIKRSNGEKSEICQPDIDEAQDAYEDLYINVSADSYDKVDSAIALIELLLTPVTVNSKSIEANATVSSAVSSSGADLSDLQQVQNNSSQPGFLQYQSHNAHRLSTPQANDLSIPSSGYLQSALPNNSLQLQPPDGSFSMLSYTGPPPLMDTMPRNPLPIPGPQPPMPNTQQPQLQFQPNPPIGPPFGRPPGIVSPQLTPSSTLPGPVRPLQTPHASGGWLNFSSVPVQPQRLPTFMPVRPPISVSPLVSSPQLEGAAAPSFPCQSNIATSYGTQHPSGASFAPSAALPSIPPGGPQSFPSVSPQGPSSMPMLSSPAGLTPQPPYPLPMQMRPPMAISAQMRGPPSSFPQAGPTSGMPQTAPSSRLPSGFGVPGSGIMPAMRPLRPSTGDFTFRPHVSPSPTPELGTSGSQMPLFHPSNWRPPMARVEGFQRPLDMGYQPGVYGPPPHPHLGGGFLPRNPGAPRTGGFVGAFPLQPPAVEAQRPLHVLPPPQQKAETSSGRQGLPPIYDPFVPSAVSGGGKGKAEEDKAEYEDLMASVGVK
ncbi:branchpoint-bridging protein isoform X2 [Oryza brachyantha]|uniref:branchpoint-bridging protein isoform X2 n=1 Tax=Oryza brachyantha TaxID=4533 RepID=UPI0003EAB5E8|nr:branchpoint-bridging protein isoform X2 [Oryza brachyantha]